MKKSLLLLLLIWNVGFLNAQDIQHESNAWFDFKIAQFFGLSNENIDLEPGHIFTVWLLPATGGINVGFINWQSAKTIPWPNFLN